MSQCHQVKAVFLACFLNTLFLLMKGLQSILHKKLIQRDMFLVYTFIKIVKDGVIVPISYIRELLFR